MNSVIIDGMSFAMPLFIIAIGGIYSERSGITNLALEGLQGFGAFIGALFVTLTAGSFASGSMVPFYLALVFAACGGAVYAMLHALLCIKFKADQVISGVVVNILAMALTGFLTPQINSMLTGVFSDKFQLGVSARWTVDALRNFPVLGGFFTNVYPFEVVILIVAAFAWYVMYRSRFGMRLRACGDNPHAVDAAGIDVAKVRFRAVVISGALAGIGGISFAYSISASFSSAIYMGYGYLSIAALIFGNCRIMPTFGACLLFGFARSAGYKIVQMLGLPSTYSDPIMTLPYVLTLLLLVFFSGSNRAPRALGEIYDKGKR